MSKITNADFKLNRSEWLVISNIIFVILSLYLQLDMYIPSLPHIQTILNVNTDQVQLTFTFFLFGAGSSQLIFGPMSDRFGRKPLMIIGMSIAIVGNAVVFLCHSILPFLCGRLLEGFGAGAGTLLARSMILDLFTGKQLSVVGSYVSMLVSLSVVVGPALGGYFQTHYGWRSIFIFLMILLIVGWVIFSMTCPETNQQKKVASTQVLVILNHYKILLTSRIFMGYLLGSCAALGLGSVYAVVAPFLFQGKFHLNALQFGYLSLIFGGAVFLGKFLNTAILKKLNIDRAISLGFLIIFVSGLLLSLLLLFDLVMVQGVIISILIANLSIGFMGSNAFAGSLSPFQKIGGTSAAVYGCLISLFSFIFSTIVALLPWHNTVVLMISYFCLSVLGASGFYLLVLRAR